MPAGTGESEVINMIKLIMRLCCRKRVAYADGKPWDMAVIREWGEEVLNRRPGEITITRR